MVVVWAISHSRVEQLPEPQPAEEDLAAPYREGLHAAIRMQGVALALEQQLYAEALRHAEGDLDRERQG
jgi:hypothetical protein